MFRHISYTKCYLLELLVAIVPGPNDTLAVVTAVPYTSKTFKSTFSSQLDLALKENNEFLRLAHSALYDYFMSSDFMKVSSHFYFSYDEFDF